MFQVYRAKAVPNFLIGWSYLIGEVNSIKTQRQVIF